MRRYLIYVVYVFTSVVFQINAEAGATVADNKYRIFELIDNCMANAHRREANFDKLELAKNCNSNLVKDVKTAISQGASVNTKNNLGQFALRHALSLDKNELDDMQFSALMDILIADKAMLNATGPDGETLLMQAAYTARPSFIKRLLEEGANPNAMTAPVSEPQIDGRPVAVNPKQPVSTLATFVTANDYDSADVDDRVACIRLLAQYGADLNIRNEGGATALMIAVLSWRKPDISIALLDLGADVQLVDHNGSTALAYASNVGNLDVIKKLLERGANANTQSTRAGLGFTPLLSAITANHEDAAILILEHTNAKTIKKASESYAYHVTGAGDTPLLGAIKKNMTKLIPLLIDKGADLNAIGKSGGQTPLMYACSQSMLDVVKLLINKGANVNGQTAYGETALMHVARWAGHAKVMELLIQNGAKVNLKDRNGSTALDYAKTNSKYNEENIALLIKYGATANNFSSHCKECSSH